MYSISLTLSLFVGKTFAYSACRVHNFNCPIRSFLVKILGLEVLFNQLADKVKRNLKLRIYLPIVKFDWYFFDLYLWEELSAHPTFPTRTHIIQHFDQKNCFEVCLIDSRRYFLTQHLSQEKRNINQVSHLVNIRLIFNCVFYPDVKQ